MKIKSKPDKKWRGNWPVKKLPPLEETKFESRRRPAIDFMMESVIHCDEYVCSWMINSQSLYNEYQTCHNNLSKHIKDETFPDKFTIVSSLSFRNDEENHYDYDGDNFEKQYQVGLRYWEFLFNKKISPYRNCFENLKFYKADKDHPDRFTHFSIDWNQKYNKLLFNLMIASRAMVDVPRRIHSLFYFIDNYGLDHIDAYFVMTNILYDYGEQAYIKTPRYWHQPYNHGKVDYKTLLTGGEKNKEIFPSNDQWHDPIFGGLRNSQFKKLSPNVKLKIYDPTTYDGMEVRKLLEEKKWKELGT